MSTTRPPYAPEFREQMVELVRSGRSPEELAREFEPSAQSIRNWVGQVDRDEGRSHDGLPGKSPKAINPVGQALRMAVMAARRSETIIGAKHRARLARMDTPVAIKATARDLACLIYLMVTEGQEYVEQGIDAYEKRRLNSKFAHLDSQARKRGC